MHLSVGCILRHLSTCRRAFSRLLDRLFEVKEDLSQLKEGKRELLRATYAAVRGEKTPDAAAATYGASDDAILGREGPLRVCTAHDPSCSCLRFAVPVTRNETGHCPTGKEHWPMFRILTLPSLYHAESGAGKRGGCVQGVHAGSQPDARGGRPHHAGSAAEASWPGMGQFLHRWVLRLADGCSH